MFPLRHSLAALALIAATLAAAEQELQAPPQEPVDNEQARIKAIRDKIAELND